jgi:hypothetical protein
MVVDGDREASSGVQLAEAVAAITLSADLALGQPLEPCARPVSGQCATGPTPTDRRVEFRLLVVGVGLVSLGFSGVVDAAARQRASS